MAFAIDLAAVLALMAIVFAAYGFLKYSDFLGRLRVVAPEKADSVFMDWKENWSDKNVRIIGYFWQKEYLGDDPKLNSLGSSVRQSNLAALVLISLAALVTLFGG